MWLPPSSGCSVILRSETTVVYGKGGVCVNDLLHDYFLKYLICAKLLGVELEYSLVMLRLTRIAYGKPHLHWLYQSLKRNLLEQLWIVLSI